LEGFLQFTVVYSGCDTKAKEHFQYTAGRYKFERDYKAFQEELEQWLQEQDQKVEQDVE
jgi:hypothetical protein